ncbi:hypothetical protein HHI36_005017 [Cryptolaemus montrouzieri]|uniref:60S ribosomal protein L13 n=1 Tax=Cryptolaemus montrouzieri TaxID=559131 RepID=A0ABD2NTU0_9CUCU
MVRHDNMIPDGHFHKNWQKYIKTWFNQPMKKFRRRNYRIKKLRENIPRPLDKLRPIVHCSTVRHNRKLKAGRGFSLRELKAAGLTSKFARSFGIAVDPRRQNKSYETLSRNVQLLKAYQANIIVFPQKAWVQIFRNMNTTVASKNFRVKQPSIKLNARIPTNEEKNFEAVATLRKARADEKYSGRRQKLKKIKETGAETVRVGKKARKAEIVE